MPGCTINSCLGQEIYKGPGHSFNGRSDSVSLHPRSLAEHLPWRHPQTFAKQSSVVLMVQGDPAPGKVCTRVTGGGRAQHTPSPSHSGSGNPVTLPPTQQLPACLCMVTRGMALGGADSTSNVIIFKCYNFSHYSEHLPPSPVTLKTHLIMIQ